MPIRMHRTPNIPASGVVTWSWATDHASVNEGSPYEGMLTRNRNGAAKVACSIDFFGQSPSLPTGTFSQTIFEMVAAIAANPANACTYPGDGRTLYLTDLSPDEIHAARGTANISGEQGAITSVSNPGGVFTTPVAHNLLENTVLWLTNIGGALPPEFAIATNYFSHILSATTFALAASASGPPITVSGAGTGSHRFHLRAGVYIANASIGTIIAGGL